MVDVGLLPFLIFGLLALAPMLDSADNVDDDPVEDDEQIDNEDDDTTDPEDPVDPATLGATFASSEDGVVISFGENETGSLAVVTYVDTEDSADNFLATHEARYYLVPEGVDWPDNTSETSGNIPGQNEYGGNPDAYMLADFEDHFGLTLLGTSDLLAAGDDSPTDTNMEDSLPRLTANRDAEYFYLEANTDGDDLITFRQEGYIETRNGVAQFVVTENTVGTARSDWLTAAVGGITIAGAGGDDTLDGEDAGLVFFGGDGNDAITANGGGATIDGGAGDDEIRATDSVVMAGAGNDTVDFFGGTVDGGDGNDSLVSYAENSTAYGGQGDDRIYGTGAGSEFYGETGDDFLSAELGVTAYGGAGSDILQLDAGGTGFGGDGDDEFRASDFYDNDEGRMFLTGGAGADVFDISVRNPFGTPTDEIFAEITDFVPNEDVLIVRSYDTTNSRVEGITVTEDPNGAFSEVEVDFGTDQQGNPVSAIIRLMGTTGVTADQITVA